MPDPVRRRADDDILTPYASAWEGRGPLKADPINADSEVFRVTDPGPETMAQERGRVEAQQRRQSERAAREIPFERAAAGLSAIDALSAGWGDEVAAIAPAAYDAATTDEDFGDAYRRTRDDYRATMDEMRAENPRASAAGTVAGVIGQAALTGRMVPAAAPAATWTGRAARAAGVGGAMGAASGAGHSTAELTPNLVSTDSVVQAAKDTAVPALEGAALGGIGSAVASGVGAGRRIYRAGRDRARLNRLLGERAQGVIESGRIPDLDGGPIDDLDLEDALLTEENVLEQASAAPSRAVSQPEAITLRSLITEPARADANVQRLRAAGIFGQPQARAVSKMPGGIDGMADRVDRLGISPRGSTHATEEGVRRAEAVRQIAGQQRGRVLEAAIDDGVTVSGDDIAAELRASAAPMLQSTSEAARARGQHLAALADEMDGRAFDLAKVDKDMADWTEIARFSQNRGDTLPSANVANAREVRRIYNRARDAALEAWDPQQARDFHNAQLAYQTGVTISPTGGASRARLQEMNRAISPTDYYSGGTGASVGSAIGGAIGGPVGAGIGFGVGGVLGTAANRGFRKVEPSLFASMNEGPEIARRLAALQPEASRLPAGLERFRGLLSSGLDATMDAAPQMTGNVLGMQSGSDTAATSPAGVAAAQAPIDDVPTDDDMRALGIDPSLAAEPMPALPTEGAEADPDDEFADLTDEDRALLGLPPRSPTQ